MSYAASMTSRTVATILLAMAAVVMGISPVTIAQTAREAEQVEVYAAVLLNDSETIDTATRTRMAAWLIETATPGAIAALESALRSGFPTLVLPVVTAAAASDMPPPALQAAAMDALLLAPKGLLQPLGLLLSQYQEAGGNSLAALIAIATDAARPLPARQAVVAAIAAFGSRGAAQALISIMSDSATPPPLVESATDSMAVLTGLPPRKDPRQWRTWWETSRDLPPERWLSDRIQALSRELAQTEFTLQQSTSNHDALQHRLIATYQRFLPTLPLPQRREEILTLLSDPLEMVREYGISRAEILLSDGNDTPEIQIALASLLQDVAVAPRRRAAALLADLQIEGLPQRAAEALIKEEDPSVTMLLLEYFRRFPSARAVEPALAWLVQPRLSTVAAAAITESVLGGLVPDDVLREEIRRGVTDAVVATPSPEMSALLAITGDDDQRQAMQLLLDTGDEETVMAIASTLARAGVLQPLIDRADNPLMTHPLLEGLLIADVTGESLRLVATMTIPTAQLRSALGAMVSKASPKVLAASATALATDGLETARVELLTATVRSGPAASRPPAASALIPLLLAADNVDQAQKVLTDLNGAAPDVLKPVRLAVSLHQRAWEDAAALNATPEAWIDIWERVTERDAVLAQDIRDQIVLRLSDQLTDAMRGRLGIDPPPPPGSLAEIPTDTDEQP
jgi:hypothetical protein